MRIRRPDKKRCEWWPLRSALAHFATHTGTTQSQDHIKPLHWYSACRLVIEGGFEPKDIMPRPPFRVRESKGRRFLEYDPKEAGGGERTVLGGLKTKDIDVVVVKEGIGPVLAISHKGAIGAFRNLTNRMEEAVGDCTNLHIAYPPMVCGYLFVARCNRLVEAAAEEIEGGGTVPARILEPNDYAYTSEGQITESLIRFHSALRALSGRNGIRDDVSRYEAVAMSLIETGRPNAGTINSEFPPPDSPLCFSEFFPLLYRHYDERYVYGAPSLKVITERREWDKDSPAFDPNHIPSEILSNLDYEPRVR